MGVRRLHRVFQELRRRWGTFPVFFVSYVLLMNLACLNLRCAGGRGHLPEQADQGGVGKPEFVRERRQAPAASPGLQNAALSPQVIASNQ